MGNTAIAENSTDQSVIDPTKVGQSQEGTASSLKQEIPEKTYTQKELDALIHMAQSKAGRDTAAVTKERDALKAKMSEYDTSIADKQAELETLQAQVDELASGSPEYADLQKEKLKVKAELKKVKEDRSKLDAEKLEHAETIKLVQAEQKANQIFETIMKFSVPETAWDSMYDLCDRFGAATVEDFEALAATIGGKKPEKEPEIEDARLHVDSGITSGGRFDTSKMSPNEKITEGLKQKIKQANRR